MSSRQKSQDSLERTLQQQRLDKLERARIAEAAKQKELMLDEEPSLLQRAYLDPIARTPSVVDAGERSGSSQHGAANLVGHHRKVQKEKKRSIWKTAITTLPDFLVHITMLNLVWWAADTFYN
ncbi:hypothetical protein FSPOR_4594 [Fusarium sporotrichioides]|uniref:Uncharacterized protein n=1 Tax=Fusarium sporotrichioides TaxID=5514 RepID=A0A395SAW6_FUSSP|nr:hypothetical protein FSPOR_4594 [Fusarium sporotrichioides]